jgi:hypothetical protein
MMHIRAIGGVIFLAGTLCGAALAALPKPAPTPAQAEAAAAKKAAADAQAAKAKEQLAASMDTLSARWRANAGVKGWTTHPPVAIATPAPAAPLGGAVPAAVQTTGVAITGTPMPGVSPRATGVSANTLTGTAAGNAAASPGGGAAPRSEQALQSANVPIKSEKLGTASPSADVKKEQTKAMPKGASPSVDRGNSKEVKNQ